MPAMRLRTRQWRRCLEQICDRNGSLEIAIARDKDNVEHSDLIWRVRIFDVTDDEICVEQPSALGHTINLQSGVELVCVMAVGQNRWMFTSKIVSILQSPSGRGRVLRIAAPESVERCQRRRDYRVSTSQLSPPTAEVWPLLDPKSVLIAERANELEFESRECGFESDSSEPDHVLFTDKEAVLPDVGPKLSASILNIGGGGLGLHFAHDDAATLGRHRVLWVRFSLSPELATPICATAKIVHTHLDSRQCIYAGMAFDFTFNPGHQQFVVNQICRYIALQQRAQMSRKTA